MNAVSTSTLDVGQLTALEAIEALHVLHSNCGFRDPVSWLEYPKVKTFVRTRARGIRCCPDCSGSAKGRIGQYVYYSTLIRLLECSRCGLVWSDVAIDSSVLAAHFETAYKDEQYFEHERAAVFEQVVGQLSARIPIGGSVLDAGGGMGHLLALLRRARPDIDCTLLDISRRSVEYARDKFGLKAICGTLSDIQEGSYDAVTCVDALYYEDDIGACWAKLDQLSDTLIIRVPDKIKMIRARQRLYEFTHGRRAKSLQDSVPGFNPEHRYILTPEYLKRRLNCMGYRVKLEAAVTRSKRGLAGVVLNELSALARYAGLSSAVVVIAERRKSSTLG